MGSLPLERWESKAALLEHLASGGHPVVVVGERAEAARNFYSCFVGSGSKTSEVGVFSSALGSEPRLLTVDQARTLLLGHDECLTWINVERLAVSAERRLGGVFFEFLPIDDQEVIVVHELGALRVAADGREVWSVDTDIIDDFHTNVAGELVLSVMDDEAPLLVSMSSGEVRR